MIATQQQFITNENGEQIAIIIPIKKYEELMEAMEELEDIKDFDEANNSNETPIPFEKAIKQIEAKRNAL